VTGNLLISVIAGISSTIVMIALGVPYAVALGLLVGILDLIPLAGATLARDHRLRVGFIHSIVPGSCCSSSSSCTSRSRTICCSRSSTAGR
jgi:hypothetical protein